MEFYTFSKKHGQKVSHFNSNFIMSRMMQTNAATNIGCMRLEEEGVIESDGYFSRQLNTMHHHDG